MRISPYLKSELVIAIFVAASLFVAWKLAPLLLAIFGGFLFGIIGERAISFISKRTKLSWKPSFFIFFISLIVLAGVLILAIVGPLANKIGNFAGNLSSSFVMIRDYLTDVGFPINGESMDLIFKFFQSGIFGNSDGIFLSAILGLIGLFLAIVIGIYYMYEPYSYNKVLFLFVKDKRTFQAFHSAKKDLLLWTLGTFGSMITVGILTAIGLYLVGFPFPWALGILAGLLSFIPNLGPVISLIPAVLIAIVIDPALAVKVVLVYIVAQALESYLITPTIQKKAISFSPAYFLIVQAIFGVLFGFLGLIFAVPIAVAVRAIILAYNPHVRKKYNGNS